AQGRSEEGRAIEAQNRDRTNNHQRSGQRWRGGQAPLITPPPC
ncbi:hypothetical protein A2U01_0089965, partial [Trifolium medium]|nr:hypothetical protein [Trifolium medium]